MNIICGPARGKYIDACDEYYYQEGAWSATVSAEGFWHLLTTSTGNDIHRKPVKSYLIISNAVYTNSVARSSFITILTAFIE